MPIILISLGNVLRRDDGIAAELCQALPSEIRDRLTYLDLGIHGEQIGEYIEDADGVIIVDAVLAPAELGSLKVIHGIPPSDLKPANSHGLSWFQDLQLRQPKAAITFVGVPVADAGWGQGISSELAAHKENLVHQLSTLCQAIAPVASG